MKIRLLTGRASTEGREAWSPGDEIDIDAAEGRRLIESGQAEPVGEKRVDKRETRATSGSRS